MNPVLALSGTAQARLIRDGQISSEELIAAHLARIEEVNPGLNAVVEVLREEALAAARKTYQTLIISDPHNDHLTGKQATQFLQALDEFLAKYLPVTPATGAAKAD